MTATHWKGGVRRLCAAGLPIAVVLLLGACGGSSVKDRVPPAQDRTATGAPSVLPGPGDGQPEAGQGDVSTDDTVTSQPVPDGVTRVAVLLPLSGPDSTIGKAMLDAAQMAVFDIANDDFRLTPFDTAGTPEGARAAAEKALSGGARLILGPLFSTSVAEVAPLAREAGINVIAFSNNRAVAAEGTYLIGMLPSEQVERVVAYAGEQGLRRFAALVPESPFGQQVALDLQEIVARFGGVVTKVQTYPPGQRDLSQSVRDLGDFTAREAALKVRLAQLKRRRDAAAQRELRELEKQETLGDVGYDAILLPQHGSTLKAIAALLPFYDIDTAKVQLLGMASWHEPGLGTEPPLVGAWYPAPQLEARLEFDKRFSDTYGYSAPLLATLAYDATALAAALARMEGGPNYSVGAITSPSGFAGTGGIFRFLPDGQSQRRLAIMEVRPSRIRVLSPASQSFRDLTN